MTETIGKCYDCGYECLNLNDDLTKEGKCKKCGGLFKIIKELGDKNTK